MSFYISLLLAFGLGLLVRPFFESSPATDSQYDELIAKFFRDPDD